MKGSEIKPGTKYVVEMRVDYRKRNVPATVIEATTIVYRRRSAHRGWTCELAAAQRTEGRPRFEALPEGGVKRIEQPSVLPVGHRFDVESRCVLRPWTAEDDEREVERLAQHAANDELRVLLEAAGLVEAEAGFGTMVEEIEGFTIRATDTVIDNAPLMALLREIVPARENPEVVR